MRTHKSARRMERTHPVGCIIHSGYPRNRTRNRLRRCVLMQARRWRNDNARMWEALHTKKKNNFCTNSKNKISVKSHFNSYLPMLGERRRASSSSIIIVAHCNLRWCTHTHASSPTARAHNDLWPQIVIHIKEIPFSLVCHCRNCAPVLSVHIMKSHCTH